VVRRLFNALPARRRFLDSPAAENSRIAQLVRRYAVIHPQVRFSLQVDARLLLRTTGAGQVEVAVGESWDLALRRGLVRLPAETQSGYALEGWIGDRTATRATRAGITLAVNGRPVQMTELREALEAAYRPLLPRGRHPFAVLLLTCDPTDVDVNVHPTKAEVLLRRREENRRRLDPCGARRSVGGAGATRRGRLDAGSAPGQLAGVTQHARR